MSDLTDQEFKRTARFDLWLHQNELFWSRFNLLYILQGSFFLIISTIGLRRPLVKVVLVVTLIFMVMLYSILDTDRRLRNYHALRLKEDYGFDPLPPKVTAPNWISARFLEIGFQVLMFIPFVVVDIFVVFCGFDLGLDGR